MRAAREDFQFAEPGRHRTDHPSHRQPSRSWLGRKDSNLRIRDPKSRALPLGHAPTCLAAVSPHSTLEKLTLRSGLNYVAQTVSLYDGLTWRQVCLAASRGRAVRVTSIDAGEPSAAARRAAPARDAAARNRPKTAEPLPDIAACDRARRARAPRQSGAISGWRRGHRRLQIVADVAGPGLSPAAASAPAASVAASHQPNASFVLTPNAGHARARPTRAARSASGNSTIAALEAERRAALEKIRHVGAERRRDRRSASRGIARATARPSARSAAAASLLPPPRPACIGIRFARWTATSRGAPRRRAAVQTARPRATTRLRPSVGHAGIVAGRCGTGRGRARERQRVVQRDRLKDRPQLVIAVRPHAEHAQIEVDLRERANRTRMHRPAVIARRADRIGAARRA